MSIIAAFVKNKVTAIYDTTSDGYNDKTRITLYENVPCRWEEVVDEKVVAAGAMKQFSIRCWILPGYDIKVNYQVEYKGQIFEVVGLEKYTDVFGKHDHTVLYLGVVR